MAKFDDVLGFISSRLSPICVTIAWSMVACAAALGIRMEKVGVYVMGKGEMPTVRDITRCYHLVEFTSILFILAIT